MKLFQLIAAFTIIALLFTCQIDSKTNVERKFVFSTYYAENSLSSTNEYIEQTGTSLAGNLSENIGIALQITQE